MSADRHAARHREKQRQAMADHARLVEVARRRAELRAEVDAEASRVGDAARDDAPVPDAGDRERMSTSDRVLAVERECVALVAKRERLKQRPTGERAR